MLNALVGVEVACGAVVLLTHFFTEDLTVSVAEQDDGSHQGSEKE